MDLSGLKWPIVIVAIAGVGFLASSPGVDYLVGNFTKVVPGENPERDETDEAGLTRVAGYLMLMWRHEKAIEVMRLAHERYGYQGANYWYNKYRISRCLSRLKHYVASYEIIEELIDAEAGSYDSRIPSNDELRARAARLKEVYGFQ